MSIKAMLYSSRYSLSNYDHIALNGDSVRDNQIVSQ